ncbi:unnamed protein product [Cylindrotheca closterium]|uniref:Uncharacterized protein n=1 Tax=Cylindrotheca closterium TaxID=2856 RepID=A0AAD2CPN3_9STRA|nr:unnamed protein product [Cylindrotheca closterium]
MPSAYQYGSPDVGESFPLTVSTDKNLSFSSSLEDDQSEISFPLYPHPVKPKQLVGTNTYFVPSLWATPVKSFSSRVKEYQRENTPLTMPSLDDHSVDSSVSASLRHTDELDDDDLKVRLALDYLNLQHLSPANNTQLQKSKTEVFLHTFCPKFVLEVMGGSGAVWGFSEAIGLRTALSLWFWKPVSLFAGALFFIRWLQQLQEFSRLHDRRAKRRSTVEGGMAAIGVFHEDV